MVEHKLVWAVLKLVVRTARFRSFPAVIQESASTHGFGTSGFPLEVWDNKRRAMKQVG